MPIPRRSPLALAVLSMLTEAPMHPYRMQQLIKERHKQDVINVTARNSVYQTIQRLQRSELIEVDSVERTKNRPERTTYRITENGRGVLGVWLRAMLGEPENEYPEFPAALSFLPNITEGEAVKALKVRIVALEMRLAALETEIASAETFLPKVFLVETHYQKRLLQTELTYVEELVAEIGAQVTWQV